MEDNNIVLKDTRRLYLEFLHTKDIYQKYLAFKLMQYFYDLFSSDSEIAQYYQEMSDYFAQNDEQIAMEEYKYNYIFDKYLSDNFVFFEDNLPLFSYQKKDNHYQFLPLSQYDINFLLESFFWSISHHLYRFYRKSFHQGKILIRKPECDRYLAGFANGERNGRAFTSSVKREKSYVYVNAFTTLEDLVLLVHEMGHAYFFNVIKYHYKDMIFPEKEICLEIPSRTLEYLFIMYLKSLNIPEASLLEENFYARTFIERRHSNLFARYQYSLGNLFAITCGERINREITFEKYCKAVYYADFEKMVIGTCNRYRKRMQGFQKSMNGKTGL